MAVISQITTNEELDELPQSPEPALLLKHSTACPSSAYAKSVFTEFSSDHPDSAVYAMVLVIESRPLSNAVADRLSVRHQSPQVVLVEGGQAAWHASHYSISNENLEQALLDFCQAGGG